MKIYYDNIAREDNMYMSIPLALESCCHDSMLWLFRYPLDISIKEGLLIKKDANGFPELFKHCQFCGGRHTIIKVDTGIRKGGEEKEDEHIPKEKKTK